MKEIIVSEGILVKLINHKRIKHPLHNIFTHFHYIFCIFSYHLEKTCGI